MCRHGLLTLKMILFVGCWQCSEASIRQPGEGSSESGIWQVWRWQCGGKDQICWRHSSGETKSWKCWCENWNWNNPYCVVCPFHWMFAPLVDMPKCQMLFFWNRDEPLWINSPSASFQSCLPGLSDTHSCKISHLLKTWELASFFILVKEKKNDSNWRVSVSFSKLQGAEGSFTFLLDWLSSQSQSVVHPSWAPACQFFHLTSEADCRIDVW